MFSDTDEQYLINSFRDNKVVLFLGAGASYGSTTSRGDKIPLGEDLTAFLRMLVSDPDPGLRLDQIGKDVQRMYGDAGLRRKLEDKFLGTRPSAELETLFSFKWNRCYTLNYDDTIEGISRYKAAQRHRYYVGTDKVEPVEDSGDLQIVHLNGSIRDYDKGIVLTDREFRARIRKHTPWYQACASDFASKTFIFIGTKLDEPIFKAYIESIEEEGSFARSFLVTPDDINARDKLDLKDINIEHLKNTLEDFVLWLHEVKHLIEGGDSNNVRHLIEVGGQAWLEANKPHNRPDQARLRRNFYSGMYPTWQCIAAGWPAKISALNDTLKKIRDFERIDEGGVFLLKGQAGSGKTTALMHALYEISLEKKKRVFEFSGEGFEDLQTSVAALLRQQKKCVENFIVWVPDFQIYADEFEKISRFAKSKGIKIVGELRSSDWSGRFYGKHAEASMVAIISQLKDNDYEILADAIQEYATAPEFRKLSKQNQVKSLKKSRNQLLILMMEATKQRPFEEIIEHEYDSLSDNDVQAFLCIVALITKSRSRLSVSDYHSMVSLFGLRGSLAGCVARLDGIIELTSRNTVIGRHESYLNHILSSAAELSTLYDACLAILRSFTVYKEPYVLNAGKIKGNILKFLMRGDFLSVTLRGDRQLVERLYDELEYDYQNDGHYWLQRGKYYRSLGSVDNHKKALDFFDRAVQAYDNPFARHSLAQQKLIYCAKFNTPTPYLEKLLEDGVAELNHQLFIRQDADDEYPIVALATSHPDVLLAWGRREAAKSICREYHKMLQDFAKGMSRRDKQVDNAIAQCLQTVLS